MKIRNILVLTVSQLTVGGNVAIENLLFTFRFSVGCLKATVVDEPLS